MPGTLTMTPPMGVPISHDMSSISPRGNDDNSICSRQSSNFYSTIEDILKPPMIERLVEIFYHTIYPMLVPLSGLFIPQYT